MRVRDSGAITARSLVLPGVLFAISLALVAGAWFIGFRTDLDMSAEVGTGRNRTTAAIGVTIVGVFAVLALLIAIRTLRRQLGFTRSGSAIDRE